MQSTVKEEVIITAPATSTTSDDSQLIPSLRFPQKLWRIVNECRTGAIGWGNDGLTVLVDYDGFAVEYLGCEGSAFKTSNVASFIRQLNLYGFRKVSSHQSQLAGQGEVHEFLHEFFRAGRLDLLSRVCRKTGAKRTAGGQVKQAASSGDDSAPRQGAGDEEVVVVVQEQQEEPPQEQTAAAGEKVGLTRLQMCQVRYFLFLCGVSGEAS